MRVPEKMLVAIDRGYPYFLEWCLKSGRTPPSREAIKSWYEWFYAQVSTTTYHEIKMYPPTPRPKGVD